MRRGRNLLVRLLSTVTPFHLSTNIFPSVTLNWQRRIPFKINTQPCEFVLIQNKFWRRRQFLPFLKNKEFYYEVHLYNSVCRKRPRMVKKNKFVSQNQEDEYLHRLSTTNNEIPGAVAAVNILFMS